MASNKTHAGSQLNAVNYEMRANWKLADEASLAMEFIDSLGEQGLHKWTIFLKERAEQDAKLTTRV